MGGGYKDCRCWLGVKVSCCYRRGRCIGYGSKVSCGRGGGLGWRDCDRGGGLDCWRF